MPTNLTGNTIASTFDQLLHVDDGPTATEKTVYSGTGVATALKVGTESISVENLQLDGNTLRSLDTNGNISIAPNGTGSVAMTKVAITGGSITGITDLAIADGGTGASTAADARTNLGLGTIATQDASNVAITGGSITNVTFTGSFSGMTLVEATTMATSAVAAGCNLNGNTLAADGTDTNIDVNITPKGTGEVNIPKVDIDAGAIDGTAIGATTPSTGKFTQVDVDNLRLDGNTISSTDANGNITLTPNGTGAVKTQKLEVTGSFGYAPTAGGTVTQATSKSTAVTINKLCGQIVTNNATLNRDTSVNFVVNNSLVGEFDVVVACIHSGATLGAYELDVDAVTTGAFTLALHNHLASVDLSEAITINFVVIKGTNT